MTFSEKDRRWLRKLSDVIDDISKREDARLPSQEEYSKAAKLGPGTNSVSMWVHPVQLFYVTDGDGRHMVAVTERAGVIITAECSCQPDETCAHLLTVLAGHPCRLDLGNLAVTQKTGA